jgi:hypothetical protein
LDSQKIIKTNAMLRVQKLFFVTVLFVNYFNAFSQNKSVDTHPAIKDYGLKNYISYSRSIPYTSNTAWQLVCQMPTNCHFQPWIEIENAEGKTILLNSSNPLVQYLTKTESFVAKKGRQIYEAKNWISGEGAVYTIPAGATVLSSIAKQVMTQNLLALLSVTTMIIISFGRRV